MIINIISIIVCLTVDASSERAIDGSENSRVSSISKDQPNDEFAASRSDAGGLRSTGHVNKEKKWDLFNDVRKFENGRLSRTATDERPQLTGEFSQKRHVPRRLLDQLLLRKPKSYRHNRELFQFPNDEPPRFKDEPPRFKDEPPRFEDEPPRFKDEPPRFEDEPPRSYDKPPRFEDKPPRSNDKHPRFEDEPPQSNAEPPRFEDEAPRSNDKPPRFEDEPPRSEDEPPRFKDEPPRFEDEPPRSEDEPPRFKDEPPRFEDDPPRSNDKPSRFEDEPPRSNDKHPPFEDEQPRFEDEPPRFKDEPPRFEDDPPRSNDKPPRFEDEPPRSNDKHPPFEDEQPRFEDEQPRFKDEPPRFEDEPPRSSHEPPQFKDEPPRFKDEPPRFEEKHPSLINIVLGSRLPQSENEKHLVDSDSAELKEHSDLIKEKSKKSFERSENITLKDNSNHGLEKRSAVDVFDSLDEYMTEEQTSEVYKDDGFCAKAKLRFCQDDVQYNVAKTQTRISSFYDGLVEAGFDLLMIQTKGQISSCKNKLKSILCRDRFPRCTGKEVIWGQLRMECIKAIKCCPPKVQEILRNIDLCRKVGNGEKLAQKCSSPISSPQSSHCQLTKESRVAPWDKHSAIEVQNLIEMQKVLFQIPDRCLKQLARYLCLPGKTCYKMRDAQTLASKFKQLCRSALNACQNTTLSKGMVHFLQCRKIQQFN